MRRYICVVGIALAALGSSYAQTLVFIGNGISGDGRLTIPVDPFGAWYTNFNTGANNGEFYDPPGALGVDYPTFAVGTYLFVGTSYRVALNQEPGWGGVFRLPAYPHRDCHCRTDRSELRLQRRRK